MQYRFINIIAVSIGHQTSLLSSSLHSSVLRGTTGGLVGKRFLYEISRTSGRQTPHKPHILYMFPHLLCDSLTLHLREPSPLLPLLQLLERWGAPSNAARMSKATQHSSIHLLLSLAPSWHVQYPRTKCGGLQGHYKVDRATPP